MQRMNVCGWCAIGAGLVGAVSADAGEIRYRVIEMSSRDQFAIPSAINDSDQVTGATYVNSNSQQPFLYSDGVFQDIKGIPGNFNSGEAINNSTQVAGWKYTMGVIMPEAFLWTNGQYQGLGRLGGRYSYGYGMNNAGDVVGYYYSEDNSFVAQAFAYRDGVMRDIGQGVARDITDTGLIVGGSADSSFGIALVWEPSGSGWVRKEIGIGTIRAVNAAGNLAVGEGEPETWPAPATYWTRLSDGSWEATNITDPSSSDIAYMYGVNNSGQMVGAKFDPESCFNEGFIFEGGHLSSLTDLIDPGLGLTILEPAGINEAGHIAAFAIDQEFYSHAVLLVPTELSMLGPRPGIAGQVNTLIATGATPGARVYFTYGVSTGSTSVPGCPGLSVDIRSATLAGSALADVNGDARLDTHVPQAARGRQVLLQAVEQVNCVRSQVALHRFQ